MTLLQWLLEHAPKWALQKASADTDKNFVELMYECFVHAPTDRQILGDILDRRETHADTILQKETYAWYSAVAQTIKHFVHAHATHDLLIGEIGVRFAYSLATLAKAVGSSSICIGYDAEMYHEGSNKIANINIARALMQGVIKKLNTQEVAILPDNRFDIFHVDGDHSYEGALHDLKLAFAATNVGGYILVDDVQGLYYPSCEGVKRAADDFCKMHALEPLFVPTFRGMYVIYKDK